MTDQAVVEEPSAVNAAYYHLTGEGIAWTKEIIPSMVYVDVDANGRAVGIETIGITLNLAAVLKIVRSAHFDHG